MIRNSDLLHTSPVYTHSVMVNNMANYNPISNAAAAATSSSICRRSVGGVAVDEDVLIASRVTAATRAASYLLQRRPYLLTTSPSDDDELELLRRRRMLVQSSLTNYSDASIAMATAFYTTKNSNATGDDNGDAIIVANDTFTTNNNNNNISNNNNNSLSSRFVSQDLCHEFSNSTSMLFELENSEKRNAIANRGFNDNYLTMSAPQPAHRCRRGGGDEGEEAQTFQQTSRCSSGGAHCKCSRYCRSISIRMWEYKYSNYNSKMRVRSSVIIVFNH